MSIEESPEGSLKRPMAALIRAREQVPLIHVGLMQDGALEMWNLTRSALENIVGVDNWQEGIDRYLPNGRLGEILRFVEPNAAKGERRLRKEGMPCGSGAAESARRSLVTIRVKRCSQRWHDDGVNAVLALRASCMSERLPTFWCQLADDYIADVGLAARSGRVPDASYLVRAPCMEKTEGRDPKETPV